MLKPNFFFVISVRVVRNIPITMIVVILNVSHYTSSFCAYITYFETVISSARLIVMSRWCEAYFRGFDHLGLWFHYFGVSY